MTPAAQTANLQFKPLPANTGSRWRRPTSLTFVGAMLHFPISDTELQQSSHYLPIAIEDTDDGLNVVAITAPQFQRTALVSPDGKWQRAYVPIALRCLPFQIGHSKADTIEIASNFDGTDAPDFPLFDADGSLSSEVKTIAAMLRRLEQGKGRLRAAAEQLFIAGLLTRFHVAALAGTDARALSLLTVDVAAFRAVPAPRIATLAQQMLVLDLAAACIFSQRLTSLKAIQPIPDQMETNDVDDDAVQTLIPSSTAAQLDNSELFSFEHFAATGSHDH